MRLSEVEEKLVEVLRRSEGFSLVKGYRGEVENFEVLVRGSFPCALVVYGGANYEKRGRALFRESFWSVLVADRPDAVLDRIEEVRERVCGFNPSDGSTGVFEIISEKVWDSREAYAVYLLTFRLKERLLGVEL
jgi:hypothetical protein